MAITRRLYLKRIKGNLSRFDFSKKESFFDRKVKIILRNNFGFIPADLTHYKEALRHRSSIDSRKDQLLKSNERLEFLGDSLLGAYTAAALFERYPDADEGFLTKLRAKIVSRNHLNKLAFELQINQLVKNSIPGQQLTASIYGNALEAIFGAIYLEKGILFLHKTFQAVFENFVDLKSLEATESDFKSKLYEHVQKEKLNLSFELVNEEIEANRKHYSMKAVISSGQFAEGRGTSKKKAEQEAAQNLCILLNLL